MLRDERVIGSVSTWTEETYSSRMFRQVDFLLEELGLGLDQVDLFAVASGPGSFTGLRVGLAAIKAWAEVYGKPVAGVSALEAIAEESRSASPLLVPAFDARRGEVYFGVYRREGDLGASKLVLQGEHSVMTPVDFLNEMRARGGKEALTIVTPTPEALAAVAVGLDGTVEGAAGIRCGGSGKHPGTGGGIAGCAACAKRNYGRFADAGGELRAADRRGIEMEGAVESGASTG